MGLGHSVCCNDTIQTHIECLGSEEGSSHKERPEENVARSVLYMPA